MTRTQHTGIGVWITDDPARSSHTLNVTRNQHVAHRWAMVLTHHFAFAVENVDEQFEWRNHLFRNGYTVSDIKDRDYFRSIYTKDPDGHIVELATNGPGFAIDEDVASLGQTLQLPAFLEPHREQIKSGLKPLVIPEWINPLETEGETS